MGDHADDMLHRGLQEEALSTWDKLDFNNTKKIEKVGEMSDYYMEHLHCNELQESKRNVYYLEGVEIHRELYKAVTEKRDLEEVVVIGENKSLYMATIKPRDLECFKWCSTLRNIKFSELTVSHKENIRKWALRQLADKYFPNSDVITYYNTIAAFATEFPVKDYLTLFVEHTKAAHKIGAKPLIKIIK